MNKNGQLLPNFNVDRRKFDAKVLEKHSLANHIISEANSDLAYDKEL